MAIWLPRLAIDRWRRLEGCAPGEGADAAPVALVRETAHGPRITAVNRGPHNADAYYIGGMLPKNTVAAAWDGPKGTECDWYDDGTFFCETPHYLEVDDYDVLSITATLKKGTRGVQTAVLGVETYDRPTGAETLTKEEFEELNIKGWLFMKKVKTRIVR